VSDDDVVPRDYQIVVFAQPGRGGKRKLLRTFHLIDSGRWEPDDARVSRQYQASLFDWVLDAESDPQTAVEAMLSGLGDAVTQIGLHASMVSNGPASMTLDISFGDPPDGNPSHRAADGLAGEYSAGMMDAAAVAAYELQKAKDQEATRRGDAPGDGNVTLGGTVVPMLLLGNIFDVLRASGRHAVNISAIKTVRSRYGAVVERLAALHDAERAQHQQDVHKVIASIVLPSSH
jgi:hypothetical protein